MSKKTDLQLTLERLKELDAGRATLEAEARRMRAARAAAISARFDLTISMAEVLQELEEREEILIRD